MKSYEEVTKDVMKRSEEVIANKYKRRRRVMAAVSTSATCLVLAGALGVGIWLSGRQGGDIVLTSDPKQLPQTALENTSEATANVVLSEPNAAPLELLSCKPDENGNYSADGSEWKPSENYDLYRTYFFGAWEGELAYPGSKPQNNLIIDDSEKSYLAETRGCWFSGFYEVNSHVLAFAYVNSEGLSVHWLDTENPSYLYIANTFLPPDLDRADGLYFIFPDSTVYTMTKTNIVPNKPENGFLSVFKLQEMARDYGINYEALVDIIVPKANTDGEWSVQHNSQDSFYPVYLISETFDKLIFKSQVKDTFGLYSDTTAVYILEKTGGEWERTAVFFSYDSDIPADRYESVGYCEHLAVGGNEVFSSDPDTPPQNGTVYISKSLREAMDFYGDTFNDGCYVRYRINIKYYKNGEPVVPTRALYDSELNRLEDVRALGYDENGEEIGGLIGYHSHSRNWGEIVEHYILGSLNKLQLENFTAGEDYGIALYLDDVLIEGFSKSPEPDGTLDPIIDFDPTKVPTMIDCYPSDNTDPEEPPKNGEVYITSALSNAIESYGDIDENGNNNLYAVTIDYFADGERIDPDEDFFEGEKKRLTDLLGDMSDFIMPTAFDQDGKVLHNQIDAYLTKTQVESLTADKSFGCVIYLRENFSMIKQPWAYDTPPWEFDNN